ncbi:MAG: flagellar hook-basal body complex protein FliE [Bacteriovorax sp.]|jgi:flagellar hook-basal body complex protein FliE
MAIENVGNMNKLLSGYNTQDWMKSASIDQATLPQFNELAANPSIGVKPPQSFSEMLATSLTEVNEMQVEANKAIQKLASGQSKDIAGTMLAVENAEIAFKTMNQVRMKVIEAYKEIMRMQM